MLRREHPLEAMLILVSSIDNVFFTNILSSMNVLLPVSVYSYTPTGNINPLLFGYLLLFSFWSWSSFISLISSFPRFITVLFFTHTWSQLWHLSYPFWLYVSHTISIFFPYFPITVITLLTFNSYLTLILLP